MTKRILCLHRRAPGLLAREALDVTLIAGVFDQSVSLLFRDEGVLQLLPADKADNPDIVALEASIRSLPGYGINDVFICARSLSVFGLDLDDLILRADALTAAEQVALIAEQDMVLND